MATEDQLEVSKMMIDNSSSSLSSETGGEEATDWLAEGSSPCFVERSDTAAGLYDIPMMGINSTLFLGSTPDKESERVIAWCVEDKQVNTMGGDQGCSSRTTWLGFCLDNDPLFAPQHASPPKMEQEVEQERAKSNGLSFTSSCTKKQPKDKTLNLERLQQRCTTPIWGWPEFSFKKEAIKNENELGDRPTTMHPRNSLHFHSGGVSKKSGEASNGSSLVAQDDVSGLILADKDIRKRKESFLPGRELLDEVEFFSPDNVESSLLPSHLRDVASDVCSHAEASSFLIKHDIGSITKNAEKCFQRIVSPVEDVLEAKNQAASRASCLETEQESICDRRNCSRQVKCPWMNSSIAAGMKLHPSFCRLPHLKRAARTNLKLKGLELQRGTIACNPKHLRSRSTTSAKKMMWWYDPW